MMANYDAEIQTAAELIDEFGQQVILRRASEPATPDPEKPWIQSPVDPVTETVTAVFLDYALKYIDGTTILIGDKKVFIAAQGVNQPSLKDKIVRNGEAFNIISCNLLQPAEQVILYELQVRT